MILNIGQFCRLSKRKRGSKRKAAEGEEQQTVIVGLRCFLIRQLCLTNNFTGSLKYKPFCLKHALV
jgi:hypothetical protein